MLDMPYFMTNKEWYRFDFEKDKFVLTEKAPEEAKKSYKKYMKEEENPRKYKNESYKYIINR